MNLYAYQQVNAPRYRDGFLCKDWHLRLFTSFSEKMCNFCFEAGEECGCIDSPYRPKFVLFCPNWELLCQEEHYDILHAKMTQLTSCFVGKCISCLTISLKHSGLWFGSSHPIPVPF